MQLTSELKMKYFGEMFQGHNEDRQMSTWRSWQEQYMNIAKAIDEDHKINKCKN
jgi:hypothetical protein